MLTVTAIYTAVEQYIVRLIYWENCNVNCSQGKIHLSAANIKGVPISCVIIISIIVSAQSIHVVELPSPPHASIQRRQTNENIPSRPVHTHRSESTHQVDPSPLTRDANPNLMPQTQMSNEPTNPPKLVHTKKRTPHQILPNHPIHAKITHRYRE